MPYHGAYSDAENINHGLHFLKLEICELLKIVGGRHFVTEMEKKMINEKNDMSPIYPINITIANC